MMSVVNMKSIFIETRKINFLLLVLLVISLFSTTGVKLHYENQVFRP